MANPEATQLNFFAKLDRLKIGELIAVPIEETAIGGELLNILSKGLYTNPLDAIREYAQNSIDADADEVVIQVTGNSVYIHDRGKGMNRDELLQAREFGVSTKSIEENVGFRGIGLYSGFDLCERLTISTKTQGESVEHILEIEFRAMREILESARKDPSRPVIPLSHLLGKNTYYRFQQSDRQNESYSIVQLEELSDNHIHKLSDVKKMGGYILRNLPVRFNKNFRYGDEIEQALSDHVPGYKSARVVLRIESAAPVVVEKPNIPDLLPPEKGYLYSKGKAIAYYWACLVGVSDAISSTNFHNGDFQEYAEITYKIKGFTIGDKNIARRYIKRIPDWWTGEIYIIDASIIPTSARDDFEAGPAKDALELAVQDLLSGPSNNTSLQKIALNAQATRAAERIFDVEESKVNKLQDRIESGDFDQFQVYSELNESLRLLKRHKGKSKDKSRESRLINRVQTLQKVVKKEIDQPTPVSERRREATQSAIRRGQEQENAQQTQQTPESVQAERESVVSTGDTTNLAAVDVSLDKLLDVIETSGWTVAEEDIELVEILGEAIVDALGTDSETYARLMQDIGERLTELVEEG